MELSTHVQGKLEEQQEQISQLARQLQEVTRIKDQLHSRNEVLESVLRMNPELAKSVPPASENKVTFAYSLAPATLCHAGAAYSNSFSRPSIGFMLVDVFMGAGGG